MLLHACKKIWEIYGLFFMRKKVRFSIFVTIYSNTTVYGNLLKMSQFSKKILFLKLILKENRIFLIFFPDFFFSFFRSFLYFFEFFNNLFSEFFPVFIEFFFWIFSWFFFLIFFLNLYWFFFQLDFCKFTSFSEWQGVGRFLKKGLWV